MLTVSQIPWNTFLEENPGQSTSPDFRSRVRIQRLRDTLQAKHVISALYEVGLEMGATLAKDQLYAGIVLNNRPIGFLRYEIKPPGLEDGAVNGTDLPGSNDATKNLSTTLTEPSLSVSSALSARRSGTATNPADPRFRIEYEFDGIVANNAAVFSAFVDAIATAAQYDNDLPGGEVAAWSSDRSVSIVMRRDKDTVTFTWGDVKSALTVLWRQIIIGYRSTRSPAWEDVTFLIFYDGRTIGEGFIVSYESHVPPSDTTVAK